MDKKQFNRINLIVSLVVLALSAGVYLSTIEPTTSFWDCGEFIASSYKLEVGHPPGNPSFNLFARFFTMFTGAEHAAVAVNAMSALCSAFTIFFLYLTIVHFGRRIFEIRGRSLTKGGAVALFGAGVVGAMAYCFSDTFWFSAVEGEVYAMSSLFTAVVFWAILKWEEQFESPYANRWLVLICFLMGISVGVHLLNLLTIPALVFICYYKMHKEPVTLWKAFLVLCLSGVILAVILFGIIPYVPRLAAFVDRIFVNSLGARFNVGAAIFMILLLAACFTALFFLRKKDKPLSHTIVLCFTTIVIGYSLFAITVIRSCAGTPTNEYQPDNPYTLIRYLGREQYGSNPILYGQAYTSPYEAEETEYYTPLGDSYYKADNIVPKYPSSVKMLFPRMWNGFDRKYIEYYKTYSESYNTRQASVYGQKRTVQMPKFKDNLTFFFDYQLGFMYWRYFMWNFVGRQNDFHGQTPNYVYGNWESGIGFLDRARLGDQSDGPDILTFNKGKNHYFFLPLLLGLVGFFFQLRHDKRNSWVTFLLFILTGVAIVVYLNQPPFQVRERDYAYAGSFYVFALWIGLGVLAVQDWLDGVFKKNGTAAAGIAVALCLSVPVIMGCQNWDDHDRSGRYTARDMAYNYLAGTLPNSMLVTHGDNDTFPLWYAQEVEGIRTDVRIVNSSLLGTDWYIDQMQCKFYESEPLKFSIRRPQYLYGTNDFPDVIDAVDRPVLASEAIAVFTNPKYVASDGSDFIPQHKIILPVNKENAIKSGIVSEKYIDRVEDSIEFEIQGNVISKFDLMMLDLLSNYDWSRPLYFVSRGETKLGLDKWLQYDGCCYRLVPVKKTESDGDYLMDEEDLYEKLMNIYRFDSLKAEGINVDYQNLYTFCAVSPVREMFVTVADAMLLKGDRERAVKLLDRCIEVLPEEQYPYNLSMIGGINDWSMLSIIEDYFAAGAFEKGADIAEKFADECLKAIYLYSTPVGEGENDIISKKHSDDVANEYFYLIHICENYHQTELVERIKEKIKS